MTPKIKNELICGEDCTLNKGCKSPYMKLDGNINAELLFIGEGPGVEEDKEGRPFIGKAGGLLREALGMVQSKFAMTNAVVCRTPDNRNPTLKEMKTCYPRLMNDVKSMPNLKLIVLLGNIPLQAFCGIKGGILKLSGKLMQYNGYNILPIMHPAYVLRNQDELKTFYDHINRIPNALDGSIVDPEDFGEYEVINDLARWEFFRREIRLAGTFAYDLETNGLKPYFNDSKIKCIGMAYKERHAILIPTAESIMSLWDSEDWKVVLKDLKTIFESRHIRKIAQNAKFDNLWLRRVYGIEVRNTYWDTKIAQHLLNENASNGLKDMVWQYTKLGGYESALQGKVQDLDNEDLQRYCMVDVDCTYRIYKKQEPHVMADPNLSFILTNLLVPVSQVLSRMEENGIRIDMSIVDECEKKADETIEGLAVKMKQEKSVVDWERDNEADFNPNSHTQLRDILFKYEGLPIIKETPKAKLPSTDREVLEELADKSNLCNLLVTYSIYSSFRSKSINEIRENLMPDGKIHTTYWLTNTVTGRTASDKPNLQNIPKGEKDVLEIRRAFIAEPECLLVEFDYNQHELRVMAELANDDALREALKGDVHRATAASILKKKPEDVTPTERDKVGKVFNFGIIYGMTEYGMMKRIGCDKKTALVYLSNFFSAYYKTYMFMQEMKRMAREKGYVISRSGRYRRLPCWEELDDEAVREAINMPVQSLAGDILLYSLIKIDMYLREKGYRSTLILETHDSCLFNMYLDEIHNFHIINDIKLIMLTYFKSFIEFKTPLDVSIKIGTNLHNMEEMK